MEAEARMLSSRGHKVHLIVTSSEGLPEAGLGSRMSVGIKAMWDRAAYRKVRSAIHEFRPGVVHCHNTFPTPSPSIYYAASAEKAAVVQTLHNYRVFCINALLYRDGHTCSECLGRPPWRGIVHRCYRESMAASAAVAAMIMWHRVTHTWEAQVDRYIALTEESRRLMMLAGLPADRIRVKPNFVSPDPGQGAHAGGFAAFVGRLSRDKGVETLIEAWGKHGVGIPLRIAGDGPLRERVQALAARQAHVAYLGQLLPGQVRTFLQDASLLIVPSISPEGMPLVILEAFAVGLPVVASEHPNLKEIVSDAGWFFGAGDAAALSARVREAWHADGAREIKGKAARNAYRVRYSEDSNYGQLCQVYAEAIERNGGAA